MTSFVPPKKGEVEVPTVATLTQGAVARPLNPIFGRNGLIDKYFYFSMSLLVAAIAAWGFSYTVNANLFHPAIPRPIILYFHAAAFSGWLAFFILQTALVRTHNVRWHRTLGWFGAALGSAMVMLGCTTSVIMARFDTYRLHMPGQDAFLIVPFTDMLAFGTCFGLAVLWRAGNLSSIAGSSLLAPACCSTQPLAASGRFLTATCSTRVWTESSFSALCAIFL
jgi:hypothetical protein